MTTVLLSVTFFTSQTHRRSLLAINSFSLAASYKMTGIVFQSIEFISCKEVKREESMKDVLTGIFQDAFEKAFPGEMKLPLEFKRKPF